MPEVKPSEILEKDTFSFIVRDGVMLQGYEWLVPKPKSAICMVHGLGEHMGRYEHIAAFFNKNDFSFYAFDLRGHGLSEGKRGHTPSLERSVNDIEEFLMYVRSENNDLALFLYGHSLGGNFVANYLLTKNTNELQGAIISSPWLRLKKQPSNIDIIVAKWVNKIFPAFSQSNRLDVNDLTNLDKVNKAYEEDNLVHDQISARMFQECQKGGLWALKNSDLLKLPVLMLHGAEDNITDPKASQEFSQNAGDLVEYRLWQGTKHEPHNDVRKEEILVDIKNWITNRL